MTSDDALVATIREAMRQARLGRSCDSSFESLDAYLRGELPAAESEALRDHLALCVDCVEVLLDLEFFRTTIQASQSRPEASQRRPDVAAGLKDGRSRATSQGALEAKAPKPPSGPVVSARRWKTPLAVSGRDAGGPQGKATRKLDRR